MTPQQVEKMYDRKLNDLIMRFENEMEHKPSFEAFKRFILGFIKLNGHMAKDLFITILKENK